MYWSKEKPYAVEIVEGITAPSYDGTLNAVTKF